MKMALYFCGSLLQKVFLGGLLVKTLPANAGNTGLIPGLGRSPGEGNGNPLQYFCLGNTMDRNTMDNYSLLGYSPWDHKRFGHDLVAKQ